ncbi:MAG: PD-(D/E)XK nuclease family protein [Oscillospiraceae bacterium]|nr:PD-(D/E)XK nuclease family protein [Oscillospiraceae bacterium]
MQETMIYAPGFNDAVLLRTMALHGVQRIGCRVTDDAELAEFALMRSGISVGKTLLEPQETVLMLAKRMQGTYFRASSLADAEQLAAALHAARMLIPRDEQTEMERLLPKGMFPEKNQAVLDVYRAYLADCADRERIDSIMLMRMALEKTKPGCIRGTVTVPETVHLSPLEQAMLDHLFGAENVKTVPLAAIFDREEKPAVCGDITACYGAANEVRHILAQIAEKQYRFDTCTVAVTDLSVYAPLFREIAAEYSVPVGIRAGIPLRETAPAKLFRQVMRWQEGFCGTDALNALIFCDSFDCANGFARLNLGEALADPKTVGEMVRLAGALRLSMDAETNKARIAAFRTNSGADAETLRLLRCAEIVFGVFEQGYPAILRTFSVLRGKEDRAALNIFCESAERCAEYGSTDTEGYLTALFDKTLGAELPEAGKVFVTDMQFAPEAVREHMFLAGLSADNFPGSIPENYYLLDADLLEISPENALTSERLLMNRKADFEALVRLLSALDIRAAFSYSDFQSAELKDANASSVLFEIWAKANGDMQIGSFLDAVKHVGYFAQPVSETELTGQAYLAGTVKRGKAASPALSGRYRGTRKFSPTAIEKFQKCGYRFMLEYLLRVKVPDEDDVFKVIPENALGTLLHAQFQHLADDPSVPLPDFLVSVTAAFEKYLAGRPPIHEELRTKTLNELTEMAKNGYARIDLHASCMAEQQLSVLHEASGIILEGFPDRVETAPDGTKKVLDFKTGRRIKHEPEDPVSCIQTLLYAYMVEHAGADAGTVSECRYLYLREGAVIPCQWDSAAKAHVDSLLDALKTALDTGVYPPAEDQDKQECKYCPYAAYCPEKKD